MTDLLIFADLVEGDDSCEICGHADIFFNFEAVLICEIAEADPFGGDN